VSPAVQRRVAVVGSGVAGLTAAYVAAAGGAHVTVYEADDRLGGHADTHDVAGPEGPLAIDTGFIVHNERTYPTLLRIFAELGVATQDSEMSMSTRDDATGLEWAGALGAGGLFPTWRNLARPAYLRMLTEIPRFHRAARRLLAASGDDLTLRDFLAEHGFSAYFARHFMEPVVAAVWSCDPAVALDYPARYLFTFLDHHGMLGVFGSPTWRTVTGGSREYVERIATHLVGGGGEVRVGTKVTSVLETATGVDVVDGNGRTDRYDAVVLAAHPDQALDMLAEPTPAQREVLGAIPYSANPALLHTDTSVLPKAQRARASWNFRRVDDARGQVTVTYDLTRLMRLPTTTRYLVTLGGEDLVDPGSVIARREYAHPLYTPASVAAQARLPECDTDRIAFAGAYHGWGFHEDGARSGAAAAERLGFRWEPSAQEGAVAPVTRRGEKATDLSRGLETVASATSSTSGVGVYRTTITHTRRTPFKRAFTHRSRTWVVDLDHLPDHGVLARFEARDHLGWPHATLRGNVTAYLAREGIDLTTDRGPGRVLLAAHPRAFGH
jgi:predicted NAD/FAD-binding protein